jgi:ferredoxin
MWRWFIREYVRAGIIPRIMRPWFNLNVDCRPESRACIGNLTPLATDTREYERSCIVVQKCVTICGEGMVEYFLEYIVGDTPRKSD